MNLIFTMLLTLNALVPQKMAVKIATNIARRELKQNFEVYRNVLYDRNLKKIAYLFVFSKKPLAFKEVLNFLEKTPYADTNKFGTVIISAREDLPPILEYGNALPVYLRNYSKAIQLVKNKGIEREPIFIWLAPYLKYFYFRKGEKGVYIEAWSLKKIDKLPEFKEVSKDVYESFRIENHKKWSKILKSKGNPVKISENHVDSVPALLWSYGCSPTASAMIMAYWDKRGYDKLVDYYFNHYDVVLNSVVSNVPNVQRELAIAMNTDTSYGGTWPGYIAYGNTTVTNSINGYQFYSTSYYGDYSNAYGWVHIEDEINASRPVHWAVLNYEYQGELIGHSLCAIGYVIEDSGDSLVTVHNTWDYGTWNWALHPNPECYDYVYPVIPGGALPGKIKILLPDSEITMIRGLRSLISWQTDGNLATIKLFYSQYNARTWQEIFELSGSQNSFVFPLNLDTTTNGRFWLKGFNSQNQWVASDGNVEAFSVKEPVHDSLLELVGFFDSKSPTGRDMAIYGDFLCVSKSSEVAVYDVSDSSLPQKLTFIESRDIVKSIDVYSHYLFVAENNAGFRVIDLESSDFHDVFQWNDEPVIRLSISGTNLYVVANTKIYAFNIENPESPAFLGVMDLGTQIRAVEAYGEKAFAATSQNSIEIIDFSNPSIPSIVGEIPVSGVVFRMKINGTLLYVLALHSGLTIYDISSLANPVNLYSYSLPASTRYFDVENGIVVVAGPSSKITLLNTRIPEQTEVIDELELYSRPTALKIRWPFLFVSTQYEDLYIFRTMFQSVEENTLRKKEKRVKVYFVPEEGMLVLKGDLGKGFYRLRIYNVAGMEVGNFRVFKGPGELLKVYLRRPASGIYFLNLYRDNKKVYHGKFAVLR